MSAAPVAAEPPTSHDSMSGGRHADAAKPARSSAATVAEPDAATSTRLRSSGWAMKTSGPSPPARLGAASGVSAGGAAPSLTPLVTLCVVATRDLGCVLEVAAEREQPAVARR